jgi:hypothetical protein
MRKLSLVVVVVAACSSSEHHNMVVLEPDAAIDSPPPKQPVAVEFDVYGTPAFIAYRDGSGAWQTPTGDAQGAYTLMVTDDYQVVVTCTDAGDAQSTLVSAMADDGTQYVFCNSGGGPTATVAVTGTMKQAGDVYMEDQATGSAANWPVNLNVSVRTHDLIAVDTGHHMLIQRGLDITGPTTLDPIDLTGAPAMTPVTLTLNGAGSGDMLFNAIELLTANDFTMWSSPTTSLYAPPSSLLGSSDYEFIIAEAYTNTQYRYADSQFTGTETSFTLPDPLTGVTFGKGSVTWTSLPAMFDGAELRIDQANGQALVEQDVRATKAWLDAKHVTTLTFDAQPPGYEAAWNVDTGGSYSRQFDAGYQVGTTSYGVGMFDSVSAFRQHANHSWFSRAERTRVQRAR